MLIINNRYYSALKEPRRVSAIRFHEHKFPFCSSYLYLKKDGMLKVQFSIRLGFAHSDMFCSVLILSKFISAVERTKISFVSWRAGGWP